MLKIYKYVEKKNKYLEKHGKWVKWSKKKMP